LNLERSTLLYYAKEAKKFPQQNVQANFAVALMNEKLHKMPPAGFARIAALL